MRATASLVAAAFIALLSLSSGAPPVDAATSLPPNGDAYIRSDEPTRAFGARHELRAGVRDGGQFRSLLRFDLSGLTGSVSSAKLKLYPSQGTPNGLTVARPATGSWTENEVTWATAPAVGTTIGALRGTSPTQRWFSIDLDPAAVPTGRTFSVMLLSNAEMVRYGSRGSSTPPALEVQLSTGSTATVAPTQAPTTAPTPNPSATATPTSPAGIPPIPAGRGQLLRKSFSDGQLAPFRILTYPNSHPGDLMIQYGRFVSDAAHISVHDGYLDLRATRRSDGTWDQAFVGTGLTGDGTPARFTFQYGTARAMARMNTGKGAWQGLWYLVGDSWGSPEIDWPEVIGGRLTANVHGSGSDGQKLAMTPPSSNEWHEYGITKTPSYIAFLYDGREVARANVSMSARMGLLADAKVGLSAPDASTPSNLFLQVAWWTVDPL